MPRDNVLPGGGPAVRDLPISLTHPPGGVLAFDLSRVSGFAYGHPGDRMPRWGRIFINHIRTEAERFHAFEDAVIELFNETVPGTVVVESPLGIQRWHTTMDVMCQQLGLRAFVIAEAHRRSAAISEVSADLVRYELLGRRQFAKDTIKSLVVDYCRERGWRVPDHNSADACMIWAWHVGRARGVARSLFREVAA